MLGIGLVRSQAKCIRVLDAAVEHQDVPLSVRELHQSYLIAVHAVSPENGYALLDETDEKTATASGPLAS